MNSLMISAIAAILLAACANQNKTSNLNDADALIKKGDFAGADALLVKSANSESGAAKLRLMNKLAELRMKWRSRDLGPGMEQFLQEANTLSKEINGSNSDDYAQTCMRLGRFYAMKHDFAKSSRFYQTAGAVYAGKGPEFDKSRMESLSGEIAAECASGKCTEEVAKYEELLSLRRKCLGNRNQLTTIAMMLLAEIYSRHRRYEDALKLFQDVYQNSLNSSLADQASASLNLARSYIQLKEYKNAEPLLQSTLKYAEANPVAGLPNPTLIGALKAYQLYYDSQGLYKESLPIAKRILDVNEKQMGANHPQLTGSLMGYADALEKVGKKKEAEAVEKRVKAIEMSRTEWKPKPPEPVASAR